MALVHWLDVLIAPLTWLARARGRRRLALLAAYAVVLGVVGVLLAREVRFRRLPGVADPVDRRAAGHVDLADADNAMIQYRRALARLAGPGTVADRERAALDLWLAGTSCPDALPVRPTDLTEPTSVAVDPDLSDLLELANREATRRLNSGNLDGSWAIIRGMIRTGLHAGRHGGDAATTASRELLWRVSPQVSPWATAPGNTSARLRGALADVAGLEALVPPFSETLQIESFVRRAALAREGADPSPAPLDRIAPGTKWLNQLPGVARFHRFWADEPRTSLRLDLVLLAGQLAHCDLPAPLDRPLLPRYGIYAVTSRTPPGLAAVSPATLESLVEDSNLRARRGEFAWMLSRHRAAFWVLRRQIAVELAVAADRLDHPDRPAQSVKDLVGPYLATPPPGPNQFDWDAVSSF